MPPLVAVLVCVVGIVALFRLERDPRIHISRALCLPLIWVLLAGSRAVSEWLAAFGWADQPSNSPEQLLAGSPIDRNVITGLLILGILVLVKRGRPVGKLLVANLPIVLFFGYCFLSVLWSGYPEVALKRWIKAFGDVVMVLIVVSDPRPGAAIKRLLAWASFLLIPLSVLLIKYYPNIGLDYNHWTWSRLYAGVTINKNSLGMICMLFGLSAEWRFISSIRARALRRRAQTIVAHGTILLMATWLFLKADSVTATCCFLVGSALIVAAALSRIGRRPALVFALTSALVLLAAYPIFISRDSELFNQLGRNSTLTGRTQIWNLVLAMDTNPLVGAGFDSFWLGERLKKMWAYDSDIHQAHNGYLEIYLNLGWIGLALLGSVLVDAYRKVTIALRRQEEYSPLWLAVFAIAITYNFTEAAFTTMCPVWIFFLAAILSVRRASQVSMARARSKPPASLVPSLAVERFTGQYDIHDSNPIR